MKTIVFAWIAASSFVFAQESGKEGSKPKASEVLAVDGESIPKLGGFTNVLIRKVEPDGLSVIHESGAGKIPIEKLTPDERSKYGITADGAAQYRKQAAENAVTARARHQEVATNEQDPFREPTAAAQEKNELEAWIGPGHQMAMDSYLAKFGPRFQNSGTYKEGVMKGKTRDQAIAQFEQTWASSSSSVRLNWAKKAMMAGQTPEIQAAAADARASEDAARRQEAEDDRKRLQDAARERRLKKLEDAERDRQTGRLK